MDKLKEKCFQEFLASEYPTDPLEANAWRNAHMRKAFLAGWKARSEKCMDEKQETRKKWIVVGNECWQVFCAPITRTDRPGVWRVLDSNDLPGGKYTGGYVVDGDTAFDSEREALEEALKKILPVRDQLNSTVDRLRERLTRVLVTEWESDKKGSE